MNNQIFSLVKYFQNVWWYSHGKLRKVTDFEWANKGGQVVFSPTFSLDLYSLCCRENIECVKNMSGVLHTSYSYSRVAVSYFSNSKVLRLCVYVYVTFLKSLFVPQISCEGFSDGREDLPGSYQREEEHMGHVVQTHAGHTGHVVASCQLTVGSDQVHSLQVSPLILLLHVEIFLCRLAVQGRHATHALYEDLVDNDQLDGGVAVEGEIPHGDGDVTGSSWVEGHHVNIM